MSSKLIVFSIKSTYSIVNTKIYGMRNKALLKGYNAALKWSKRLDVLAVARKRVVTLSSISLVWAAEIQKRALDSMIGVAGKPTTTTPIFLFNISRPNALETQTPPHQFSRSSFQTKLTKLSLMRLFLFYYEGLLRNYYEGNPFGFIWTFIDLKPC